MKKGFTLLEIMVVLIIIGILATISFTHYGGFKEKTLQKEAVSNLKLIIAAERIYRMEEGSYYNSTSMSEINDNLKLNLPIDKVNWNYTTVSSNTMTNVCAQATRDGQTSWHMMFNDNDTATGNCKNYK